MTNFTTFSRPFSDPTNISAPEEESAQRVKFLDILIMYLVLMLSGNPYFVQHFDILIVISVIIPLTYILSQSHQKITFNTIFIFAFLLGYELMHAFVYELDYSLTFFKLFLVLLLAFSVVQILKDRFIKVLTETMCIIALISFVFTALCYVPGLKWSLYNFAMSAFPLQTSFKAYVTPTLLVYTFHPQYYSGEFSYVRNAGIFWESGAFAVFLILTLYLHYISKTVTKVSDLFDKRSVIMIIAVLTTTSTMGFLALMVLLTFFTLQMRSPIKFVFLLGMVMMAYISFVSIDFLGSKISTQLEESSEKNNRFGAALMDWEDIKERPMIGSSRRLEVIIGKVEMTNDLRRPNGLTNFLRDYGLIYFTLYFAMVYMSFKKIFFFSHYYHKVSVPIIGLILLWLLSFSEIIFDLPLLKALIFLGYAYVPQYVDSLESTPLQHELGAE